MTTTLPSRAAIDNAEPLTFPDRKPAKQDLTITIKAVLDGFPIEIVYTGSIDQLLQVTQRLRSLGATEPVSGPVTTPAPTTNGKAKAERVEPLYKPSGEACCPVHMKPLSEGRFGLYCPSKAREGDVQNDKGYCALKFAE
jgi:hypothetical protein